MLVESRAFKILQAFSKFSIGQIWFIVPENSPLQVLFNTIPLEQVKLDRENCPTLQINEKTSDFDLFEISFILSNFCRTISTSHTFPSLEHGVFEKFKVNGFE
jgi:hypothetical protein